MGYDPSDVFLADMDGDGHPDIVTKTLRDSTSSMRRNVTSFDSPVVVLLGHPTNKAYMPREDRHRVIHGHGIEAISVEEAYIAARTVFTSERTASLFAS